jgi:hypothetical protein
MPRNHNKTPCSVPGCRAWAVRGSDPPRCSPHSAQTGAPPANDNRFVHGFYASVLHPEDLAALAGDAAEPSLDPEIAIVRLALRRILRMLVTGTTPGPNPLPLTADDYARFIGLTFQGAGALSRPLRAGHALSAAGPPPWAAAVDQA